MYAYVNYADDSCKATVQIKDIKCFRPNGIEDFNPRQLYWIRWGAGEEFYKGQILFMKETRQEVEEVLLKNKRIRVPKVLSTNPEKEESFPERKELKEITASQKSCAAEGKQANLISILKERQAEKKRHPLSSREKVLNDDDITTEGSDDEVVPKIRLTESLKKAQSLSKKYQEALGKVKIMEAEVDKYKALNIELQECLLSKLRPMLTPRTLDPQSLHPPGERHLATPVIRPENGHLATCVARPEDEHLARPGEDEPTVLTVQDDKIHIGEGVWIQTEQWRKISANQRDSMFVKELAVSIWGSATLSCRSLEGKGCPTTKATPRPPLTPKKYRALKGCFQEWLKAQKLEEAEVRARATKVGKYISEKIMDINKKNKKQGGLLTDTGDM